MVGGTSIFGKPITNDITQLVGGGGVVIADADDDVADFGDVADDANVDLSDNEVNPKG